jgi:hypothetical protein
MQEIAAIYLKHRQNVLFFGSGKAFPYHDEPNSG